MRRAFTPEGTFLRPDDGRRKVEEDVSGDHGKLVVDLENPGG